MKKLNHFNYYRLPWNLADNSISWLEPTYKCNLYCEGCYRRNEHYHKSLDLIKEEIEIFCKNRKTDGISIAGGEPLLHPEIIDIVKIITGKKIKPIINTNGHNLTKELLVELKKAGVFGFTFHIDSKQGRPGWKGKNEIELNELRYYYARMLADVKGLSCSFNSTVYEDTMQYIPEMLKWAHKNIDIVNVMVFILYRAVNIDTVDYYIGPIKKNINELVYNEIKQNRADINSDEIVELIRTLYSDFECCAYLNGTQDPTSFKWLLSERIGSRKKIFGYLGSKGIEIIQTFYHLFKDRYLAYTKPKVLKRGRFILLLGIFDKELRKTLFNYLKNPFNIFSKLYIQTVTIIQPIDILSDGSQNMCDGCPDITVWNDKLVWSCRLEEQLKYGLNLQSFPKNHFDKN